MVCDFGNLISALAYSIYVALANHSSIAGRMAKADCADGHQADFYHILVLVNQSQIDLICGNY